jgi:hypothetical protein
MIVLSTVQEIDRLLREGKLSQRKIAARLRVSRSTVAAIAKGERQLYGRETGRSERDAIEPSRESKRCPACGYLVYMPCVICMARHYLKTRPQRPRESTAARVQIAMSRARNSSKKR